MKNRVGEISKNKYGTKMEIISYNGHNDITIRFLDEYKSEVHTVYQNFRNGSVKNPYDKTVYGIGYLGVGKYKVIDEKTGTDTRYETWRVLLARCYVEKHRKLFVKYDNCYVCEEWLNYQKFSEWYENNFYRVGTERMQIDKDILVAGNQLYSPKTCIIVPQSINLIFTKHKKTVDPDLPTGIKRYHMSNGGCKYQATYRGKYLGVFNELKCAIDCYNSAKLKHISEVAELYKQLSVR